MGLFRRRAAAKDVMTALVEAGSAADLVALYDANPVLATRAALRRLTELIHFARNQGSPRLVLAYWWRREFVYQAHHVGVSEAARELVSRVEWYSRVAQVVLLATESRAVDHLVLATLTSRATAKQDVPFLDDQGRVMPDKSRWRTAGTLSWQMSRVADSEIDDYGALVLSTIGLALAPDDEPLASTFIGIRAQSARRCADRDDAALDWAVLTAEQHLADKMPGVNASEALDDLLALLERRARPGDVARAEQVTHSTVRRFVDAGNHFIGEFRRTREMIDVDLGLKYYDAALRDSHDAPVLLNIGNGRRERYLLTRDPEDITQAIEAGFTAVEGLSRDDDTWPAALSNLSLAHRERFLHEGRGADIDAAIDWGQAAVDAAAPDDEDRPRYLCNLADAYSARLHADPADTGKARTVSDGQVKTREQRDLPPSPSRLRDLSLAIDHYAEAIALAGPHHPDLVAYVTNHGGLIATRAGLLGVNDGAAHLDTSQREGLRLVAPDDPRRAGIAFTLGSRTGDADLLAEAATQDNAPPDVRLNAALWWADTDTDLAAKLAAHRIAVDMLVRLAWRGRVPTTIPSDNIRHPP